WPSHLQSSSVRWKEAAFSNGLTYTYRGSVQFSVTARRSQPYCLTLLLGVTNGKIESKYRLYEVTICQSVRSEFSAESTSDLTLIEPREATTGSHLHHVVEIDEERKADDLKTVTQAPVAAKAMSRPPTSGSDHARWKSMPPGSDVYEQALEDLLQSSCSSSTSSDSSSSTSCSTCSENCPDHYSVSAAAELRDDRRRSLGSDLQTRLNLGQGQDLFRVPGQGRFDGIARSRSWSPRPDTSHVRTSPARGHPGISLDYHPTSTGQEKERPKYQDASDEQRDQGVQICDFVEDLDRQPSVQSAVGMGNSTSTSTVLEEKRFGSGDGRRQSDPLASKRHKSLPPLSGKEKNRSVDSTMGSNHSTDVRPTSGHVTSNNGHLSPSGGHAPSHLAAPGRVVTSPELRNSKSGVSSPQTHKCNQSDSPVDHASNCGTDHSHTSLSRLYPRPGAPRGQLPPFRQHEGSYDNVGDKRDDDVEEGAHSKDDTSDTSGHKGEDRRWRTRQDTDHPHAGRNGNLHVRGSVNPPRDINSGRPKPHRSPSSSPVPIPQLHSLHELGARFKDSCSAHAHKCKQHVRLCTYNQKGIPSISIDEAEDDCPAGDQFRPRSMSDASVLHVRRRRQLPRTPLHAERSSQDDEHVHVHWADEERGSPLATSVLLTSIRPRALSHGSVDMPKKPILKKPYGF
ncbi:hypothetical protein BaRGS_00021216, partial [Batillaria attramentaria]